MNLADILILIGMGILALGGLMFLVAAFREGFLWGVGCILLPVIGQLLFIVCRWDTAKGPFLFQLCSLPFWLVGVMLGPGDTGKMCVNFLVNPKAVVEGMVSPGTGQARSAAEASRLQAMEKQAQIQDALSKPVPGDPSQKALQATPGQIPQASVSESPPSAAQSPAATSGAAPSLAVEAVQSQKMMDTVGGGGSGAAVRTPSQVTSRLQTKTETQAKGDSKAGKVQRLGETFKKDEKSAAPVSLAGVAPTGNPNVVVCTRPVAAYNPSSPGVLLGEFLKDSVLTIGEKDAATGMYAVTYQDKDGKVINALCGAEDLGR